MTVTRTISRPTAGWEERPLRALAEGAVIRLPTGAAMVVTHVSEGSATIAEAVGGAAGAAEAALAGRRVEPAAGARRFQIAQNVEVEWLTVRRLT